MGPDRGFTEDREQVLRFDWQNKNGTRISPVPFFYAWRIID